MGTWNNLQEGFTVNERLPDTLVDVAVWLKVSYLKRGIT